MQIRLSKTNIISLALIGLALFTSFFRGSIGILETVIVTLLIPAIVHGLFIVKGIDVYKILELGVHPYDLGFKYQGNGHFTQADTGAWVQFDSKEELPYKKLNINNKIKSLVVLYSIVLVISISLIQFIPSKMSDEQLYSAAIEILEDEFVKGNVEKFVDMQLTYPSIDQVTIMELDDGFKGVTGGVIDQFGDTAAFGVGIQEENRKIKDYWWVVRYKNKEWTSW